MTKEEAKEVFLNRGFIEVEGGTVFDGNKWRQACVVISKWLEQEPKTGHWIDTGSGQECSECGEIQHGYDNFRYFCAYCGAKMVEPQESEE